MSFAPGEVHVERWKDPGLKVQYNQKIPQAIDKVIDPAPPAKGDNMPDTMVVDGFESKVYRLEDPTKEGESIFEKLKAPTTMFGFAPLPWCCPKGFPPAGLVSRPRAGARAQGSTIPKQVPGSSRARRRLRDHRCSSRSG